MDLSQLHKIKTPEDINRQTALAAARAYLQSTDWYVLRQVETGHAVPDAIKEARKAARATCSEVSANP